jgi:hypothetical protein
LDRHCCSCCVCPGLRSNHVNWSVHAPASQVTQGQQRSEASSLEMVEATQPLLQQIDKLARQLAVVEEERQESEGQLTARCAEAEGTAADLGQQLAESKMLSVARLEEVERLRQQVGELVAAASSATAAASAASAARKAAEIEQRRLQDLMENMCTQHSSELAVWCACPGVHMLWAVIA